MGVRTELNMVTSHAPGGNTPSDFESGSTNPPICVSNRSPRRRGRSHEGGPASSSSIKHSVRPPQDARDGRMRGGAFNHAMRA